MPLRLSLGRVAGKFRRDLQAKQRAQIDDILGGLLSDPRPYNSIPLDPPWRRIHAGEFRVIYRVTESHVVVPLLGKRNDDEIYRLYERMQK